MPRICPGCEGRRTYTEIVPHYHKYNGVQYRDPHTPSVERLYPCKTCGGSGLLPDSDLDVISERTARAQLLISDAAKDRP